MLPLPANVLVVHFVVQLGPNQKELQRHTHDVPLKLSCLPPGGLHVGGMLLYTLYTIVHVGGINVHAISCVPVEMLHDVPLHPALQTAGPIASWWHLRL